MTVPTWPESADEGVTEYGLLREAYRRMHDDPMLRYRAQVTARVVRSLRVGDIKTGPRGWVDDDRIIAAIALVVADLDLPGSSGPPVVGMPLNPRPVAAEGEA